jgi:hypothetical protein
MGVRKYHIVVCFVFSYDVENLFMFLLAMWISFYLFTFLRNV